MKTSKPNFRNGKKPSFGPDSGPVAPNSGCQLVFFSFKNLSSSVTRYYGLLSSCTISEKSNDAIMKKFSEGRTDRRADGQTDGRTDGRE